MTSSYDVRKFYQTLNLKSGALAERQRVFFILYYFCMSERTMTTVSTVKVVDKRIEPQPEPVYAVTISPKQNQWYKIPASGLSDSYITFNNLTTLGADRAYLDTFELEITAVLTFDFNGSHHGPANYMWTFDSFPFNKCCEEAKININGGAFFSQPLSTVRMKERYWNEQALNDAYANVCPCHKPMLQNELGIEATTGYNWNTSTLINQVLNQVKVPSRFGTASEGFAQTSSGAFSSCNNSIVPSYTWQNHTELTVTWREPIFASPFSSKMDANYGRPLYNITSMDLAFNMQDLTNMIRVADPDLSSYSIHLQSVLLCYQVETLPPSIQRPLSTVVPYRRFVPYITEYNGATALSSTDPTRITMTSGVYTLNEVPTAIWIAAAPVKAALQTNLPDGITIHGVDTDNSYGFNKLFGFLEHVSISMANTTQILNTAEVYDLYRIAKANGCQDDFTSWSRVEPFCCRRLSDPDDDDTTVKHRGPICAGAGSVLRLIPGTDLVLPEQELIPGANANNMVFQCEATFSIPRVYRNYKKYALWLLFEYVGVATITPGQCQIQMNPLGNGAAMSSAPVISASNVETPSNVEGSGWLDKLKHAFSIANNVAKDTKILSKALSYVPHVGSTLSGIASSLGYGEMGGRKRKRSAELYDDAALEGGAVMGMGDFI